MVRGLRKRVFGLNSLKRFVYLISPNKIEKNFAEPTTAKLVWSPINRLNIDKNAAKKIFYIIECLEESDDVQNIYTNINISNDVLKQLSNEQKF